MTHLGARRCHGARRPWMAAPAPCLTTRRPVRCGACRSSGGRACHRDSARPSRPSSSAA
jgi:hypothetical protein